MRIEKMSSLRRFGTLPFISDTRNSCGLVVCVMHALLRHFCVCNNFFWYRRVYVNGSPNELVQCYDLHFVPQHMIIFLPFSIHAAGMRVSILPTILIANITAAQNLQNLVGQCFYAIVNCVQKWAD
jgi:hypothetical protein